MENTLTLKRLKKDVLEKLELLHNAQIDIKELISNAIINYEISEKSSKAAG